MGCGGRSKFSDRIKFTPSSNQHLAQVISAQGRRIFTLLRADVQDVSQAPPGLETISARLKGRFSNTMWLKRGSIVVYEPTGSSGGVKGEITDVLSSEQVNELKMKNALPPFFLSSGHEKKVSQGEPEDFVNKNYDECESD